jgi:hypothetical protein
VPIEGRTLGDAGRTFCDALNRVLATTVTRTRLVLIALRGGARLQIAFRDAGRPATASLRTSFGPMTLYVGQVCESVPSGKRHRLITVAYTYTLTPEDDPEPLFRWEYVRRRPDPGALWCRHHLQGPVPLRIGGHEVSLNDLHLPTGYVTLEEVLRFCIVDLGVTPLSGGWDATLEESYRRFKDDFAPR